MLTLESIFKKTVLELPGYVSPPQQDFCVKLNQNECPFDVPETIKRELTEQIGKLAWNRYPINHSPELRRQLADWHEVVPDQILLGNGSNQLFQTLLLATVQPGDAIVYFPPTFSLFELYSMALQGEMFPIICPPDQDFPLMTALDTIARQQPKLVLLCSPNNPTGLEIKLHTLEQICSSFSGLVFFDEAYGEFSNTTAIHLLRKFPNLIISRTFSKAFSLAGLRFGYLVANSQITEQLLKINLPYNVNLITELIALRLLRDKTFMLEQVNDLIRERNHLYQQLLKISAIRVYPSSANFLLVKSERSIDLYQELKKMGVLVRDVGSYPLLHGHIRVTIGSAAENQTFLDALLHVVNES